MWRIWYRIGFIKGFQILSWKEGHVFCYDTTKDSDEKYRPAVMKLVETLTDNWLTRDQAKLAIKKLNEKLEPTLCQKTKTQSCRKSRITSSSKSIKNLKRS